ncbi:glycosyltransferase family protein [Kocuria sp.]|uniref:glycosyltransferase family protein n=1 Tax=Kocuria sp. TaxID=1871328 RepID=UPI0026E05C86|nr:glycosyltransferase [Kocuria sp.]MDO5617795.1 glycosyltransferase [Kocuria sp.]
MNTNGFQAPKDYVRQARAALWHLRQGGPSQVRQYLRRQKIPTGNASAVQTSGPRGKPTLTFPETKLPTRWDRAFAEITVGTILDDFSAQAFGHEWNQIPLQRDSWQQQLDEHQVQLLFVESAWHGNEDQWQYQLTGTNGVKQPFKQLMAECKRRGIPTVFWNKEDPPHYQDFLECAGLFDHVFTSDVNRVEHYKRDLGHDRVGVLAFAAQPAIHSPARPTHGFHERDVAFGGMYFAHKFPERREQMDLLLGGAADVSAKMEHGLEIFSRYLGDDDRYQFPSPLDRRVVGSLSYRQMLTAYQAYKVFLNVNSVVDSPSMCARRIFEIMSRGTPVVSTPSAAVREFFQPDELPVVADRQAAADVVRTLVRSPEYADRMVRKAQRAVWDEHTYTHRAAEVLTAALGTRPDGSAWLPEQPAVSAVLCTNRPHNLDQALKTIGAQVGVELELVVVCHGFVPDHQSLHDQARASGLEHVQILNAPQEWSLGECFNVGVQAATGQVITKMDDDDWYGPNYLRDQLAVMRVTGADVVGKQASYLYVQSSDVTLLRFGEREHRWTDFVLGPTLMARRAVFEQVPFEARTTGEDSAFLRSVIDAGCRVYASDRFNFRQFRGGHAHTWAVEDQHILSTGVVVTTGDWLKHIQL